MSQKYGLWWPEDGAPAKGRLAASGGFSLSGGSTGSDGWPGRERRWRGSFLGRSGGPSLAGRRRATAGISDGRTREEEEGKERKRKEKKWEGSGCIPLPGPIIIPNSTKSPLQNFPFLPTRKLYH